MQIYKVGAPKGGRVHWLLWHLPGDFKRQFDIYFDFDLKNYLFVRSERRRLLDVFVVSQSSKHWFRGTYFNCDTCRTVSFGYRSARIVAEIMTDIFKSERGVLNIS